jgi:hypothetical protein
VRHKRRDEIKENLGNEPEVVVVNYKKYNKYPEPEKRLFGWSTSNWLKLEVKGLHDRGFEGYARVDTVVVRKGKARSVKKGGRKVFVVGRIPYERIVAFDWTPDPAYSAPRFYVAYTWRRRVFSEVVLYEESSTGYMYEMEDIKYVGEGGGPIARTARRIRSAYYQLKLNRMERERRDERYRD